MRRRDFLGASVVTAGGLVVPIHVAKSAVGLFVADSTSGPPTITSLEQVTGNFNHGSTIRINGSGFGNKPTAAPLWFDDMTGYSNGEDVNTSYHRSTQAGSGNCSITPKNITPEFRDNATGGAPLFGASTTSIFQNYDAQRRATVMKRISDLTTSPIGECYFSEQIYWDKNKSNWVDSGDPNPNAKKHFLYGAESFGGTGGYDLWGLNHTGANSQTVFGTASCVAAGSSDPDDITGAGGTPFFGDNGVWDRMEAYKLQGDPGVQNGKLYCRSDNQIMRTTNGGSSRGAGRPSDGIEDVHYGLPNSAAWQDSVFPNGITTTDLGCTTTEIYACALGLIDVPFQDCANNRNPGERPTFMYVSEVYIDNTGARIEAFVETAPVETNAGGEQERLIQIPTSWNNNTIEFTINKSSQYDNDISSFYIAVWKYPTMEISNSVQLSTAS